MALVIDAYRCTYLDPVPDLSACAAASSRKNYRTRSPWLCCC